MAKHDEFAMFRRFKKLNCLNLLYLQAEIMELEDSLDAPSATDDDSSEAAHRKQFASDWQYLSQKQANNKHHPQWDKFLHLRERLAEYSENRPPPPLSSSSRALTPSPSPRAPRHHPPQPSPPDHPPPPSQPPIHPLPRRLARAPHPRQLPPDQHRPPNLDLPLLHPRPRRPPPPRPPGPHLPLAGHHGAPALPPRRVRPRQGADAGHVRGVAADARGRRVCDGRGGAAAAAEHGDAVLAADGRAEARGAGGGVGGVCGGVGARDECEAGRGFWGDGGVSFFSRLFFCFFGFFGLELCG